jgi:type IV pilus assembly protein PilF
MKVLRPLALVLVLAGCASGGGAGPDNPVDAASEGQQIAEMGSPRDRARIHTELAAAYYELGNMGVALEEARMALAADENYAPAYNVLGLVHMDLKEMSQAESNFNRALRIAPNDPDANHNYGWFLCQGGREDQGVKFFLAAVRNPLYTSPQKSYTLAGICAMRRNGHQEAVEYLERALRLDPNYLGAVLPLAEARYQRGELEMARTLVGRYNRAVNPTAESLWLALRIERRLGDKSAENGFAEQLRRRFSGSPEFQSLQKGQYE